MLRPIHQYRVSVMRMRRIVAAAGGTEAAELVEFAISLPLLVVFVVGIYDFGLAFTLKQKLADAASLGARIASNQPTNDLSNSAGSCGAPVSVCTIRDTVDGTLTGNHVNDCGLGTASATSPSALTWIFSSTGSCTSPLTLTIERGYAGTPAVPLSDPFNPAYQIEASRVTLSYPYQWQFNRVIGLLAPGANYPTSAITSIAVMQNLN
jgi:Flp pilus assembly protein TadG